MQRRHAVAGAASALAFAVLVAAAAGALSIRTFHTRDIRRPEGIAAGADGALWFANAESRSIGRITVRGRVRTFTSPSIVAPTAIVRGPDGAMWFSNGVNSIGRITSTGAVTTYPVVGGSPVQLTVAGDTIWYSTGGKALGRLGPDGISTLVVDAQRMRGTYGVAAGSDGAIWFTNYLGPSIGRVGPDGIVTTYTDPRVRYPDSIVAGPDHALWFADDSGSVGRITTAGKISVFAVGGHPDAIAVGPARTLWVADRNGSVLRFTTAGASTRYRSTQMRFPAGIAAGTDGAVWFTNYLGDSIGRIGR